VGRQKATLAVQNVGRQKSILAASHGLGRPTEIGSDAHDPYFSIGTITFHNPEPIQFIWIMN